MRMGIIFAVAVAGLLLAAAPAFSGAKMAGCDAVTAPGAELNTSVELTNDLDRPARYKISAQVHGDRENVLGKPGKVRGRKTKQMVTLGAGESLTQDLVLSVPDGAFGPLVVTVCITGPGGKEEYEAGTWSFPDGEIPDPTEPGDPWEEPEVVTLTGTVYLNEDLFPPKEKGDGGDDPWNGGDDPMPPDGWLPPPFETELRFVTDEGAEWQLLGPEAWFLAELMWEAGLTEAQGTVEGFPVEDFPILFGERNGLMMKRPEPVMDDVFFVVSFDIEGVDDPREKLVWFRWFLDGPLCALFPDEDTFVVAHDQTEFDDMLADAGIILPECPEPTDPPDDPVWIRSGFGMENGGDPSGMPDWTDPGLPPDDWYWCPWEVNFDEETIIGVFAATQSTTGYMVCVDQILKEDDGSLTVKYWIQAPSEWDWVAQVETSPFVIVAIPKIADDVVVNFEKVDAPTWYYDERPVPEPVIFAK